MSKQKVVLTTIEEKEAQEITNDILISLKQERNGFWNTARGLKNMLEEQKYKFLTNSKTSEKFKNFEEYCEVMFDMSRSSAFNYITSLEYWEKYHTDVQPVEHDSSKIALLRSIDKPEYQELRAKLDKKVLLNKISRRQMEDEISQVRTGYTEIIDLRQVNSYDENICYISPILDKQYDTDVICIDTTWDKDNPTLCRDYYPTMTCHSMFYKPDGTEFTIREYGAVQDFPSDYKFVGSFQEIKKQIGNAVSPKMAEYVIKKHITGNTYLELFAGCGGLSLGAHNAEKICKWATDYNKYAAYSYHKNFPAVKFEFNDIREIDTTNLKKQIGDIDFIVGGPPCQGFSVAGLQLGFDEDPRNKLYLEFVRFVKEFKPKQFVMENVPPILEYKDKIIKDFEEVGYSVVIEKVNGLDIGMKQNRTRVFFVGTRRQG